jgi:2-polyprenyl-3-methyl-5-hydroxy-6-metoxy-1,4-benzoquinol methylase
MSDTDRELSALRWAEEYRRGRYVGEPPVAFVEVIINTLNARPAIQTRPGLYVGCGNGRNYLPLVDAGLNLYGLDIAPEALRSVAARRPAISDRLISGDFARFESDIAFAYVVALQVFQHGSAHDAEVHLCKVSKLLPSGGLFFLRVNSAATEVYYAHRTIERTDEGGFTVRYLEGPKRDLAIHFFTKTELLRLTRRTFRLVGDMHEEMTSRTPPKAGSWAQWEMICEKR